LTVRFITSVIVTLLVAASCSTPKTADTSEKSDRKIELQQIVDNIEIAEASLTRQPYIDTASLSTAIDRLDTIASERDAFVLPAHYYIARAADTVNDNFRKTGGAIDRSLADKAIQGYAAVIANGKDISEWNIRVSNAEYYAGNDALNDLNAPELAENYYKLCVQAGHAGCMNALAYLLLIKADALVENRHLAFDLLKRAVDTGTNYRCAGFLSAVTLAYLAHFRLVARPAGEEFDWLGQAQDLRRQLGQKEGNPDPCNAASMQLDEYMMRADSGDRRPDLLKATIADSSVPATRGIAEYVAGSLDAVGMEAKLALGGFSARRRCQARFYELWKAVQSGSFAQASKSYKKMSAFNPRDCGIELVVAERLLSPDTPVRTSASQEPRR